MPDRLGDKNRVLHVLDAISAIQAYTQNIDLEEFKKNSMMQDACIRQLGVIGEACNRISDEVIDANQDVAWRQIIGLRNVVIHEYFGVDNQVVWNVIQHELSNLKEQMERIRLQLEE